MHGMYMGRTILKGRTGVLPKACFTGETHYSVQILRELLGLKTVTVGTLPDVGMDPDDLAEKLARHTDAPVLVVGKLGPLSKGAVDNVDGIQEKLIGRESYLHLDAALFGGYLPFTEHATAVSWRNSDSADSVRYDSIAVSCHKFFRYPSPAGLFITQQKLYDEFNVLFSRIHNSEYIHQVPGTITCSSDAVKSAEFYYFTTPSALARQSEDAKRMLGNATLLPDQMHTHFPQFTATRACRLSNTIYFRNPIDAIVSMYALATMQVDINNQRSSFAHVIVMPHVSRAVMTEFSSDLKNSGSR